MSSPNIDERFLRPSAETQRWLQEQKPQCLRCQNCDFKDGKGMRCKAARLAYCIDTREVGAPCGPKAALYTPAN